jgi:hypothetical protein
MPGRQGVRGSNPRCSTRFMNSKLALAGAECQHFRRLTTKLTTCSARIGWSSMAATFPKPRRIGPRKRFGLGPSTLTLDGYASGFKAVPEELPTLRPRSWEALPSELPAAPKATSSEARESPYRLVKRPHPHTFDAGRNVRGLGRFKGVADAPDPGPTPTGQGQAGGLRYGSVTHESWSIQGSTAHNSIGTIRRPRRASRTAKCDWITRSR